MSNKRASKGESRDANLYWVDNQACILSQYNKVTSSQNMPALWVFKRSKVLTHKFFLYMTIINPLRWQQFDVYDQSGTFYK